MYGYTARNSEIDLNMKMRGIASLLMAFSKDAIPLLVKDLKKPLITTFQDSDRQLEGNLGYLD